MHEFGYRIETIDGELVFFDPRGRRVLQEGPRIAPSSVEAWERIRAENEELGITPSTNQCRWNGLPVQYDLVVSGLGRLDGLRGTAQRTIAPPLNR